MSKQARQRGSSIQRVELRSGPRWRFRLDLSPAADGKRRQRTLTFKSEAEAVEAQVRARLQVSDRTYTEPSRLTLDEYLDGWLRAGERSWKPSTHHSYVLALKPAREALAHRRLQQITRADIESLTSAMLRSGGRGGKGRSPRTVALLLTILGKAFKDAVADELIARNPAEHVRKPRSQHREMQTWDAEEAAAFLASVEEHRWVGAWHLTMRGLRRGEVLGLRWSDVNFKTGTVRIRNTRVQVGPQVLEGPPKTTRGLRTIPLDPELARALRLTQQRQDDGAVTQLLARGDRYVVESIDGEPVRPEAYGDEFTSLAADAGLPTIRLHDARHTALSLLLERGVPVHVVARFAGHDPSVTMRTYAHVTRDALDAAGAAFTTLYGAR